LEVELIRLSDMLLKPAAAHLDAENLVIVPDGALHLIPFAALPDPRPRPGESAPLVAGHQIVNLPSASTLQLLRGRASRRVAPRQLAVLADPVFSPEDPRVSHPRPAALQSFPRLPFSEKEAEAILSLVPHQNRLAAIGFAANRRAVLGGLLAKYRYIHFATHGLTSGPLEGSGLVLSSIDENGTPQEAILRASEVSQLNLAAELVVLSACGAQSSQGTATLARSFLDAGASRVLVSSWDVSDRAAARFMTYFYRNLLVDKDSPAVALRKAQESMRAVPSWSSPYYWASFSIQGDWR
jgi:CHAT domain-containing protein